MTPTYIPAGSEFDEDLNPVSEFETRFLRALRRKKYHTASEKKKVVSLEKKTKGNPPKIPLEYVLSLLKWIEEKNYAGLKPTFGLDATLKIINNPDRLIRWQSRNKADAQPKPNRREIDW